LSPEPNQIRLHGKISCGYIPINPNRAEGITMTRVLNKLISIALLTSFALSLSWKNLYAAPGEVIISHASMSTTSIPLWVTQRQNFFAKYGVKTKVVWVRGNPAQIATLVSGDTQIAYGGAPTAIAAAVGGVVERVLGQEDAHLVHRYTASTQRSPSFARIWRLAI
jgi:hypothetical protein